MISYLISANIEEPICGEGRNVGIPNLKGGDLGPPRLLVGISLLTAMALPTWSRGPRGDMAAILRGARNAGYEAVQCRDAEAARKAGLVPTAIDRLNRPQDARSQVIKCKAEGYNGLTLHAGTGFETDDEARRLAEAIVEAAEAEAFPVYLETHRATMTQDMKRTLDLAARVPGLRFNGDYAHWYTGCEIAYGDIGAKIARLQPITRRTRFLHGRISGPGCIQIAVNGASSADLDAFRRLWVASFEGFLRSSAPGDVFGFYPELLPPAYHYARLVPGPDGNLQEETDRWQEAQALVDIARDCWQQAKAAVAASVPEVDHA